MSLRRMEHAEDPREKILKETAEWIGTTDVYHNQILLAVYNRAEHALKTESGLFLPQRTASEDEHQGKAALVLKKGPMAFVDEGDIRFHGQDVEVGDWIAIRPSDGWPLKIYDTGCRIIRDVDVRLKITSPDCIY